MPQRGSTADKRRKLWRGWCVLYTGTGLSDPKPGDLTAECLEAAAAAGMLAAARLRITWTTTA
jgi:hypothetical protein